MRISIHPIVVALFAASAGAMAADDPAADIERSFFPYDRTAAVAAVPRELSKENWQLAERLLPAELLDKLESGELHIRTQATTDLPPSAAYVEATRRNVGKARLREDGGLQGYEGGRPFPRLDPSDPRAGQKLAWNFRYHETIDSAQSWGEFRILDATGRQVRDIEFYYALAYGMYRGDAKDNLWQDDRVYFKELYQCLAPEDVKNQMRLKFRYDDDHTADLNFAYIPETRKVRQVNVDPRERMMSSELLNEDFYGFWGYLREYDWRFIGRATHLAPVAVRAATATFELRHGYPADPWELRQMLLLEGTPKDPDHPYAKRVLFIDEQMAVPLYVFTYDRQGTHNKTIFTLYGNPAFSPGNEHVRQPLWIGQTVVNHANGHAAVTEMKRLVVDARIPEKLFTIGELTGLAR
jgi:hypothetical protein